jgi:glucosamine--fructose-6-phosphate aminotransferase (isomerizing)
MTESEPSTAPIDGFADDFAAALRDSLSIPSLKEIVSAEIEALLADPRFDRRERFIFAGSGDSLFAARSTLPALRRWTGLRAEVMTSLDFARYEVPLLGPEDALIAVSNSGNSSRTRETVLLARDRGVPTVGISGSRDGALADLADRVVYRPVAGCDGLDPDHARVFLNMAEYLATLYTLYGLALALGVRRGRLTAREAAEWTGKIEAGLEEIPSCARAAESLAVELAAELSGAETVWVLGAGPNRGTAEYCAAKFHEQIPVNGIAQDLEEWAHLQYFLTLTWAQRSVVLVLAPPGNALDRAEELVQGIVSAGGRAIVLADPAHGRFEQAMKRFDLNGALPELLTPLLYHVPVQLLVLHLARGAGVQHTPLRRTDDYWLIRKGLVRARSDGLD